MHDPNYIRTLGSERLEHLVDSRFLRPVKQEKEDEIWEHVFVNLESLHRERAAFIDAHRYGWTLHRAAYESPFEAQLQWRLLNVLSDIDSDHPVLKRAAGIVVRVVPTSSARPHIRIIDGFYVIILSAGYLSALKGFLRVLMRGAALGRRQSKPSDSDGMFCDRASYMLGVEHSEEVVLRAAQAYVGVLIQLGTNERPIMDNESIFDEDLLRKDEAGKEFGFLGSAVDGFVLFHEAAHILEGDVATDGRSVLREVAADRSAVSLCIIDQARSRSGSIIFGAPVFFKVETLRLLCEEILRVAGGTSNWTQNYPPGVEELLLRSSLYPTHLRAFLGPILDARYAAWDATTTLVHDTVRFVLRSSFEKEGTLMEFLRA